MRRRPAAGVEALARVVLTGALGDLARGETELYVEVGNIRQLFELLGARYPAMRPHLEANLAVAIDGEIYQDAWLEPIAADSEVHLLPRIAGG